ncbi:hypothetical protein JTE90_028072 [Oedothorax gibbosus]|uniref:Uncharacterized protein n=1 Tax=Oedothorax gibbosus TaxID=931172 RepID=A0AAV6VB70_9ARAC|nr:hypothetical protein JTE90_028072 [Oedothorax gibbosus]
MATLRWYRHHVRINSPAIGLALVHRRKYQESRKETTPLSLFVISVLRARHKCLIHPGSFRRQQIGFIRREEDPLGIV